MKNVQKLPCPILGFGLFLAMLVTLFSCRDTSVDAPQFDTDIVVLTDNNTLLKLNARDPSQISKRIAFIH
jgi:hypothetical protein